MSKYIFWPIFVIFSSCVIYGITKQLDYNLKLIGIWIITSLLTCYFVIYRRLRVIVLIATIAVSFIISPVSAQPVNQGESWRQTTQREQVAFVAGISHGLALMYTVLYKDNFPFIPSEFEGFTLKMETSKSKVEDDVVFKPRFILDTVDVAAAMTAIYNDPQYAYMPQIKVFVWACNIVEGKTEAQQKK